MQHSNTLGELAKALVAAQKEIKPAAKDSTNPFFHSKYADLVSVWAACREPLTSHGLSVIQVPAEAGEGRIALQTMLLHTSGEFIIADPASTSLSKDDPQGVGSAITYLRRYGLSAMVGVVAEGEDDDGNAASKRREDDQEEPRNPTCPECGKSKAVIKGKAEYGGGWLCFGKKGGCGAKWQDEADISDSATKTPSNPPTEPGAVLAFREQIKGAAQALNEGGDVDEDGKPKWTTKSLNAMSKEHFGGPVASLGEEKLGELAQMLSQRLADMRQGASQKRKDIIANIEASAKDGEVESYLRVNCDGKSIDELTTAELAKMDSDISMPF
jgi:hypothetical protein